MPCQVKIFSVNVPPTMSRPKLKANNVAIGISAVRRPCLNSTRRRVRPFADAVRRKSLPSTSSIALRW